MGKITGSDRTHVAETGGYWHDPVQEFSTGWSDGKSFFRVTGGGDFTPGTALISNNNGGQWEMIPSFDRGCPVMWTGTAGGIGYAYTPDYFVFFIGNSITYQGGNAAVPDADHYTMRAVAGLDEDVWHRFSFGNPGVATSGLLARPATSGLAPAGHNIAVLYEIRNSLSQGVSVADTYADVQTWCSNVRGLGYLAVVLTCKPDGDLDETKRGQINDLIRENWATFCDAILDLDTVPEALADNSIHYGSDVHIAIGAALQSVLLSVVGLGGTVDSVEISPSSATLYGGQTQQFTAEVLGTGSVSQSVAWSKTGVGSLSAGGLYTAPGGLASGPQTAAITATSVQDPTKSVSVDVTIPVHNVGGSGGTYAITVNARAT